MTVRIVLTGRIPQAGFDVLRDSRHELWSWDEPEAIPRDELLQAVAGADAIVSLLTERIDAEMLDAAGPQLRVVANVAVGFDNIDVQACTERGVQVTNTPGVLTDATADLAMALILMVTRRLGEGERLVRSGRSWRWGMFHLLGTGLQGRRLGIVGMGQIGAAVAHRARAFGMSIAYANRRTITASIASRIDAVRLPLEELLATTDIVSIHCPYTPETHHLIGPEQFRAMRPDAFLVNTARGPIVDEEALVAALAAREIAGAALDVYEHEPTVHAGLVGREDVVLIPHLGSATVETRSAMATLAARNALAVLAGNEPPTPVN